MILEIKLVLGECAMATTESRVSYKPIIVYGTGANVGKKEGDNILLSQEKYNFELTAIFYISDILNLCPAYMAATCNTYFSPFFVPSATWHDYSLD